MSALRRSRLAGLAGLAVLRRAPRAPRGASAQAGFTLIELMIALVMFSFAIAGVLAVAVAMVNGFREQRLTIATESASRAGMEFMVDAIRGASPGVPSGAIYSGTGCTMGAFTVVNSSTAPDRMTVVFAYGSVVTSTRTALIAGGSTLTVTDASQLAVGDTLLITDFGVGHLVTITGVSGNALTIANPCGLNYPASGYLPGAMVVRALRAEFYVAALDGIPTLFMDPDAEGAAAGEPLVEGIEDLQIAIGIDSGIDGVAESGVAAGDDEWFYNVSGETLPVGGSIRAVRLTLIARAVGPVTGTGAFLRPAAEDRAAALAPDNFRRRMLTSIIEIRNLGGSP